MIFVVNGCTMNYFFLRLHSFSRNNHERDEMNMQTQMLIEKTS
jgi:hypothetical protein